MITWVVGRGGLLGSAIARQSSALFEPGPVPWDDPEQARRTLHHQARAFEAAAGTTHWRVIWAAGAATTSSTSAAAMAELAPLEGLLSGLRSALPAGPGAFFLSSSAGGVYAGSSGAPFTVLSEPVPLSPYGELKLSQERLAVEVLGPIAPVVIGRISNLYGPGQNLQKLQGLISHLALASITRRPVNIFVPLGTIRDYIYADDAAAAALAATNTAAITQPTEVTLHIIATGRGTTIGQLLRTTNEIAKRRVPVALGTHPSSHAQAVDLRVTPSLESRMSTLLPTGIASVHADLLSRLQRHPLAN